jgi:hypothetical protein
MAIRPPFLFRPFGERETIRNAGAIAIDGRIAIRPYGGQGI